MWSQEAVGKRVRSSGFLNFNTLPPIGQGSILARFEGKCRLFYCHKAPLRDTEVNCRSGMKLAVKSIEYPCQTLLSHWPCWGQSVPDRHSGLQNNIKFII